MSHLIVSNPFIRVLAIPELKRMSANLATGKTHVHLTLVSKIPFNCIIPVLIKEVLNACYLLSLVPLGDVMNIKENHQGNFISYAVSFRP